MISAGRVALVFWEGYLGVTPSLIHAIEALARHGFQVDVIIREPALAYAAPPVFDASQVRIVRLQRVAVTSIARGSAATWIGRMVHSFTEHVDRVRFLRLCRSLGARERYLAAIGVDEDGVLGAARLLAGRPSRLIFWSLELGTLAGSRDPVRRWVHRRAQRVIGRANVRIVQDPDRARSLATLHGEAPGVTRLVPNAPAGPALDVHSRFFHDRFALPADQLVILHAGGIVPEMLGLELARAAASWPANWSLVLHERQSRSPDDPYLRRVQEAGAGRVLLSLEPVGYAQLDSLFASATVSLALYSDRHGANYQLMAGASGKLAHSCRVGVPVVCSNLPGLRALVEGHGAGLVVDDPMQIEAAVTSILVDYARFREGAFNCYREAMEFDQRFAAVLGDLDRMACA